MGQSVYNNIDLYMISLGLNNCMFLAMLSIEAKDLSQAHGLGVPTCFTNILRTQHSSVITP